MNQNKDVFMAYGANFVMQEENKILASVVMRARDEEGEFLTIIFLLEEDHYKFFKYFHISSLKFKNI